MVENGNCYFKSSGDIERCCDRVGVAKLGCPKNDKTKCGTGNEAFLIHSGFDLQTNRSYVQYFLQLFLWPRVLQLQGAFAAGEATASDRRTQLAVVRPICLFSPGLSCKRAAPVFRPEELLRTFAGEPREDPEVFIADIEAYFDKVGAVYLTPCHQILVAYRQLCGDVEKRNRYYKNIDQRVEELWDRLRRDYGADSQSQQLLATFMGATYKKTESFIDGQAQLYRRLFPRNTEKQLVAELIRQMPPTIRGTLAVGKTSCDSLISRLQLLAKSIQPSLAHIITPQQALDDIVSEESG
ncbi:hypothetical protein GEV33_001194 [Tenebrio molitor]|uniref:Uncharacterized protein n=1 Tax=Tenebrio molitor TaxID=7067 RepID=A0A8J6HVZ7_TENMO|nr:hypothetical protein GEV33_001194 [Tenebrio molitor]